MAGGRVEGVPGRAAGNSRPIRKWKQRREDGECIDLASVRGLLETRDRIDSTRVDAPLAAADDAVWIDSADSSPADVVTQIEALLRERGFDGGC